MNLQGKGGDVLKGKTVAPRSVLVSLTLMGVVKQLLKGLFLLAFVAARQGFLCEQ